MGAEPDVTHATNLAQGFETFVELRWDPKGRRWPSAAEVNDVFLGWLARNKAHRFAAYLHYMDVHDPYTPERAPPAPPGTRPALARGWVADIARAVNFGKKPALGPDKVRYLRALYDAELTGWDAELARLLAGLRAAGVADDTVVVVTADHGEEFQEHGHLKHGSHLYDEVLHVPLVIAGPGVTRGRVTEQAAGVDLAPTVLALLGVPAPPGMMGTNLLAARRVEPAISETRQGIAPDGTFTRLVSLRRAGWKLIETPASGGVEVYDLAHDPAERANRADGPEAAALRLELAQALAAAPPPPMHTGTDPQMREKLRALGYTQ